MPSPGLELYLWRKIQLKFKSEPHKVATNIEQKYKLGAQPYLESVIQDTPIGKAIKNMRVKDKNACQIFFNSAYYLAKQKQPFSDFPNLFKLQEKNKMPGIKECYRNDRATAHCTDSIAKVTKDNFEKDLAKAYSFFILSDESTDSSIT